MNDFEYDVKQKKALARNAIHRKGGSRSKRCTLSTDHMTKAEWKRRNGEIMSYDMSKPLSWKEWKSMPDDLQVEYYNNIRKKFPNIPQTTIAADLFKVAGNTLSIELGRLGQSGTRGGHKPTPSVETKNAWKIWILWKGEEPKPIPAHTEVQVEEPEPEPEYKVPKAQLNRMEFHISGANLQIENALLELVRLLPINEYNVYLAVEKRAHE